MISLLLAFAVGIPGAVVAPHCQQTQGLVVLWHKDTSDAARGAASRALAEGCFKVMEQFDGTRREATQMAELLSLPLLAIKAVREPGPDQQPTLVVKLDVIDASSEELKIKASAEARAPTGSTGPTSRDLKALLDRALAGVRTALH